jgi:hypothetical protein
MFTHHIRLFCNEIGFLLQDTDDSRTRTSTNGYGIIEIHVNLHKM